MTTQAGALHFHPFVLRWLSVALAKEWEVEKQRRHDYYDHNRTRILVSNKLCRLRRSHLWKYPPRRHSSKDGSRHRFRMVICNECGVEFYAKDGKYLVKNKKRLVYWCAECVQERLDDIEITERFIFKVAYAYSHGNRHSVFIQQLCESEHIFQYDPILALGWNEANSDDEVYYEREQDAWEAFGSLSKRERLVLYCHCALGLTLQHIGEQFTVTRERVRQIEIKALRHIRHRMEIMKGWTAVGISADQIKNVYNFDG